MDRVFCSKVGGQDLTDHPIGFENQMKKGFSVSGIGCWFWSSEFWGPKREAFFESLSRIVGAAISSGTNHSSRGSFLGLFGSGQYAPVFFSFLWAMEIPTPCAAFVRIFSDLPPTPHRLAEWSNRFQVLSCITQRPETSPRTWSQNDASKTSGFLVCPCASYSSLQKRSPRFFCTRLHLKSLLIITVPTCERPSL